MFVCRKNRKQECDEKKKIITEILRGRRNLAILYYECFIENICIFLKIRLIAKFDKKKE